MERIKETVPQMGTMEYLAWLRDSCSDEILPQVVHGKGLLKVRRNWWNGVVGGIEEAGKKGLIQPGLEAKVKNFLTYFTSGRFRHRPLTTEKDITRANDLLDRVLGRK